MPTLKQHFTLGGACHSAHRTVFCPVHANTTLPDTNKSVGACKGCFCLPLYCCPFSWPTRCIDLIQKASGASNAAVATSTQHKPRPATTQGCFPSKHQQQQQQQLKRLSMASEADSGLCGPAAANNTWLYTTTAAAANNLRPHSAAELTPRGAPIAQHSTAAAASVKAQAFRPGSAAVPAAPGAHNPKLGSNPPLGSNLKRASLRSGGLKPVNITTSQAMHGLKDLYPDLWASTVPICR